MESQTEVAACFFCGEPSDNDLLCKVCNDETNGLLQIGSSDRTPAPDGHKEK